VASPIVIPISSSKFQLDKTIVAACGSVTVDIGAATDHDGLDAILENKPFPTGWPQARLNILTFQNNHAFDLNDFLAGTMPPREQIAVAQTRVNLSS
jgi:hypothetical protein